VKQGTRVRTMGVGAQPITGTVMASAPTHRTNTLDHAESEAIETVMVRWDEPHLGTDRVPVVGLEVIDG
jgi:hypothetical protein